MHKAYFSGLWESPHQITTYDLNGLAWCSTSNHSNPDLTAPRGQMQPNTLREALMCAAFLWRGVRVDPTQMPLVRENMSIEVVNSPMKQLNIVIFHSFISFPEGF